MKYSICPVDEPSHCYIFRMVTYISDEDCQRIETERQRFMIACRAYFPDCNFLFEVADGFGIYVETRVDAILEYYPFYDDGRKYRLETGSRRFPHDYAYKTLSGLLARLRNSREYFNA